MGEKVTRDLFLRGWYRTVACCDPVSIAVSAVDYLSDLLRMEEG